MYVMYSPPDDGSVCSLVSTEKICGMLNEAMGYMNVRRPESHEHDPSIRSVRE